MKKISVLAVCFIVTFTSHLYAACTVTRGKIEVSQGQGATCSSILSAINAADGVNPVVISVLPGTYNENLTMKSNIKLQGAGREVTTINGSSAGGVLIIDGVNNVAITGFTIRNSGKGIVLYTASDVTIADNNIVGDGSTSGEGIKLDDSGGSGSQDISISNNLIEDFKGYGIWLSSIGTGMKISGNTIRNITNATGINAGATDVVIEKNNVYNSGYGIYCSFDYQALTNSCVINGNYVTGNAGDGIWVMGTRPVKITNNTAVNNSPDMKMQGSTYTNVSFNLFDSLTGTKGTDWVGNFNAKSDGTAW